MSPRDDGDPGGGVFRKAGDLKLLAEYGGKRPHTEVFWLQHELGLVE
jgi:hypothetical protein